MGSVPVAMRGPRTKGRLRWPPSTELCRSRKSANDGSVVGHSKLASFDHRVVEGEQRNRHGEAERLQGRFDHQLPYADCRLGKSTPTRPAWREDVRTRRRLLIPIFLADQA
jgi:hypothetical protein